MGIHGLKSIKATVASTIFVVALLVFYFVHMRYFRVDVLFFSALLDVVLATALAACLLLVLGYFSVFNVFEKAQLVVIWLMLGYIYAISVPTVIDRSLSFYILEKMQQRGGSLRLDRFEEIFTKEYSREHQLVAVRLTEQQASGTVRINGDCVSLTERGQRLANFSRFFRRYLLPRQRLLMGRYSDELTDPFRHSVKEVDYTCR
jgi:hypothetical protein